MSAAANKCPMCLGAASQLEALPCAHRFCVPCISSLKALVQTPDAKVPCPSCGKVGPVPEPVPVKSEGPPKCGPCETADSEAECLTCGFPICSKCVETHKRPAYSHHEVTQVGSLAKRQKVRDTRTCKTHDEELKLYCNPCQQLVCLVCVHGDHDVHQCPPVADAAKVFPKKEKLTSSLEEAVTELQRVDKMLSDAVQDILKTTKESVQNCQKAAVTYAERINAEGLSKVEGIMRQRVALAVLQQRMQHGLALAEGVTEPADHILYTEYVKGLAKGLTRSLVSVPPSLQLTEEAILKALPPLSSSEGIIHKLSLRKLLALVHGSLEFATDTPDAAFSNSNQRISSAKVVTGLATEGFSSGVHQWSVRVSGAPLNQLVGVAPKGTPLAGNVASRFGWFLSTNSGRLFIQPRAQRSIEPWSSLGSPYCTPIASGSVVTVRLDMDQRTLSFSVDGRDCGIACKDLPAIPLHPAVSLLGTLPQWAEFVDDGAVSYQLLGQQPLAAEA